MEACVLVDEVGRTLSAPVRPIDRRLADSPGVAGTAVLGDGSLVLVLDALGLVRIASRGGFKD
jgi:chemotaxis protein histidine kinase CheA